MFQKQINSSLLFSRRNFTWRESLSLDHTNGGRRGSKPRCNLRVISGNRKRSPVTRQSARHSHPESSYTPPPPLHKPWCRWTWTDYVILVLWPTTRLTASGAGLIINGRYLSMIGPQGSLLRARGEASAGMKGFAAITKKETDIYGKLQPFL